MAISSKKTSIPRLKAVGDQAVQAEASVVSRRGRKRGRNADRVGLFLADDAFHFHSMIFDKRGALAIIRETYRRCKMTA
jgi:hypothetical protein